MQRNSSNYLGNWYPYSPQGVGTFSIRFPSYGISCLMGNAWLFPSIPIATVPDTLELKAKYIKRRKGHGCNFIKKEEYKYTLDKIILPYTKPSLLLTISSKNCNSYPKIKKKSVANVAFDRKVSEGYSFKKDSQFNSYFSIVMWRCGCSASQTFIFHSLALSYWIQWHCDIKLLLLSIIKIDSSSSIREKKNF